MQVAKSGVTGTEALDLCFVKGPDDAHGSSLYYLLDRSIVNMCSFMCKSSGSTIHFFNSDEFHVKHKRFYFCPVLNRELSSTCTGLIEVVFGPGIKT